MIQFFYDLIWDKATFEHAMVALFAFSLVAIPVGILFKISRGDH